MDPVSIGTAVASPAWAAVRSLVGRNNIIAAYFDPHGERRHGDKRISVKKDESASENIWYFEVDDVDDYVFTRMAVAADAAVEQFGTEVGKLNPNPRFFRWVAPVLPGRIYGGDQPPNALVPFVVVGYKPKVLVRELSGDQ